MRIPLGPRGLRKTAPTGVSSRQCRGADRGQLRGYLIAFESSIFAPSARPKRWSEHNDHSHNWCTGRVGRHVVDELVQRYAPVRVLTCGSSKGDFPGNVEVVQGDLLDIDALRGALTGISTLFLLNVVTGDEFTQAFITLNVAREAGIERVVYLSIFQADLAVNVPHLAVKYGAGRMLKRWASAPPSCG